MIWGAHSVRGHTIIARREHLIHLYRPILTTLRLSTLDCPEKNEKTQSKIKNDCTLATTRNDFVKFRRKNQKCTILTDLMKMKWNEQLTVWSSRWHARPPPKSSSKSRQTFSASGLNRKKRINILHERRSEIFWRKFSRWEKNDEDSRKSSRVNSSLTLGGNESVFLLVSVDKVGVNVVVLRRAVAQSDPRLIETRHVHVTVFHAIFHRSKNKPRKILRIPGEKTFNFHYWTVLSRHIWK